MRTDPLLDFLEAQMKFADQMREVFAEIEEEDHPPRYECEKRKYNRRTTNHNQPELDRE